MEYIKLNDGHMMPVLGFGTFLMNGQECEDSVFKALQLGYRLIDTAQAYGNEEAVGNAIFKSGISRDELFITTKVNFDSYENVNEVIENSLKNLKVEYIDLVLLHWPFGNYYQAYKDLEKLKAKGIIKSIGVSNFDSDRFVDLCYFCETVPAINQIETHLFCQRKSEHQWMEKYHIQHQAYAPLGQGKKNEMFNHADLKNIADKYHKTPAQIALRFLIQQGVVVIPKSIREERMKENMDIFDFVLNDQEMSILSQMDRNEPMVGNAESPELVETAMTWIGKR